MSGRATSMATINTALAGPTPAAATGGDEPPVPIPTSPTATAPAPAPPAPGSKEAKEQEKAFKEQEKADDKAAKAADAQKKAADKEAADAAARTSGQLDAITGVAKSTFETKHPMGLDFFKLQNIGGYIESLPTPGTFMFPLILLLLFFFVLIPVNGHTRIVWLWMAITGEAAIQGDNLSGHLGGTPPPAPPPGGTPPQFQDPPASAPMPLFPTLTLVEGS